MSILSRERPDVGQSLVLRDVSWAVYEQFLKEAGDHRFRHTYDRGTLEIMSPSPKHENVKRLLGRLIERMSEECDIEIRSFGSMTQGREELEQGLESDECYYFANEPAVRCKRDLDFNVDPPPDLAVEVDVTSSSVGRMPIYAALGIMELWRFDDEDQLSFFQLVDGNRYVEIERSITFGFLSPRELQEFVDLGLEMSERELIRKFVRWVRRKIKP
jgi:Uma2 family endonuclease